MLECNARVVIESAALPQTVFALSVAGNPRRLYRPMCTDYDAPSGAMSIAPISIAPINAWSATGANGAGGAQELLAGEMSSPRRAFMFCAKENGKH
jgi:hypothetical protein